jgi:hypothetical protein
MLSWQFDTLYGKKAAALYTQAGDYQKTARFYYKKAEDTYYQVCNPCIHLDVFPLHGMLLEPAHRHHDHVHFVTSLNDHCLLQTITYFFVTSLVSSLEKRCTQSFAVPSLVDFTGVFVSLLFSRGRCLPPRIPTISPSLVSSPPSLSACTRSEPRPLVRTAVARPPLIILAPPNAPHLLEPSADRRWPRPLPPRTTAQANNWAAYDDWRRARDQWDYFYSRNR